MIKSGMKFVNLIFLAGLLFASAACGSSPPENPSLDSRKADDPSQQVSPPMNLYGQIEFSKKDLAQRLGIADELVVLSGARHVTWRSGALGCPDPGMNYTQALVPGAHGIGPAEIDNLAACFTRHRPGMPPAPRQAGA